MPKLTIFNKPQKGIFDEASYDDEGLVQDFNNLPTEVAVSPIPTLRIHNIHPHSQILGDPKSSIQTRSRVQQTSGAHALEEPKKISKALKDDSWIEAMQEELIFLAFASFMGFIVNQMDVKSAFLYGTIDEEVYVSQPPGFFDLGHPKKGNPQLRLVVNFLEADYNFLGNGKKQNHSGYSTTEAEYVALQAAVDKYCGFRIKCWTMTATASTLADGTLELRATIDTLEYTITEASVRSKLQLADASGISMLPNTEIFEGMGNMGYPTDGFLYLWRRRGSLDSEDEAAENSSKQGRNLQKDESEVFETPKQGKSSGETDISPQGLEAAETLAEALNVIMVFEDVVLDFQQYIKSTSEKSSYGREHVSANQREGKEIGKNKAEEELKMRRREELKRHDELATKKIARGHGKVYGYGYKERSRKRTGCRASKKIFQKLKLTREDVSIPNEMDKSQ
ncbi:ribonuclease H-like domain-containing protein [Tanacetum coccineum]